MSTVIDDERYRASLSEISPALKNYEIVLTADEKLEKYIEADIFDAKNGDYVAHFKLDNLEDKKQYNSRGFLGFSVNHETEDPDISVKADDIRKAIVKRLEALDDEDLISSVELDDTFLED